MEVIAYPTRSNELRDDNHMNPKRLGHLLRVVIPPIAFLAVGVEALAQTSTPSTPAPTGGIDPAGHRPRHHALPTVEQAQALVPKAPQGPGLLSRARLGIPTRGQAQGSAPGIPEDGDDSHRTPPPAHVCLGAVYMDLKTPEDALEGVQARDRARSERRDGAVQSRQLLPGGGAARRGGGRPTSARRS